MPERIIVQAPAKINLHLEVLGPRRDGYHDILSLFQMISLCDTVEIRSLKETEDCRIEGGFDFPVERQDTPDPLVSVKIIVYIASRVSFPRSGSSG